MYAIEMKLDNGDSYTEFSPRHQILAGTADLLAKKVYGDSIEINVARTIGGERFNWSYVLDGRIVGFANVSEDRPADEPRVVTVRYEVAVHVDADEWASNYGLPDNRAKIDADISGSLEEFIAEAIDRRLEKTGNTGTVTVSAV